MKKKYVTGIQRQEKEISDLVTSSKSEKEGLEFVRDHGSDKQTFVSIHSSKPVLDEIENKVKQLADSFVDASFVLVGSNKARNIATDNVGNIYVLGGESNNIHKITSTGTLVDILSHDNLSDPLAFCFSNDCSKVYIAHKDGEIMSVYKTNM
ncbi:unnamed protein product [Mytilus edulis]|uniref:Uncharacterized protein n=1 Tax=Mytilus edulis TaxID=6550 RepID=A0A8S3VQK7_MYTED|nr:unnamed protein product [Mytilus edulis]